MSDMRYVTWRDSAGADGWPDWDEVAGREPIIIETVGFVVADEPGHLTLTMSLTDYGHTGAWIVIPRPAIEHEETVDV